MNKRNSALESRRFYRRDHLAEVQQTLHRLAHDVQALEEFKEYRKKMLFERNQVGHFLGVSLYIYSRCVQHHMECIMWYLKARDNHADELNDLRTQRRKRYIY